MITNIYGNGYTVYYDASLKANSALGGLTYSLANGGKLTPNNSVPIFPTWSIPGLFVTLTVMALVACKKRSK